MAESILADFHFCGLKARIDSREARIGIIGLGYVGLPLAKAFRTAGFAVLGFDNDALKVERLNRGESYIGHIPASAIAKMLGKGFAAQRPLEPPLDYEEGFEATSQFERLEEVEVIVICVPTPLTASREPDLTYVINSTEAIAERLRHGQLVVLESTTYPTTTRTIVLPRLVKSDLQPGTDFFLAYSPEREDPGNPAHSLGQIPKVVGGLEEKSLELAAALYGSVVSSVVRVSSLEVAEACKILENTYRAVNIALVNELKVLYDRMGIDVWEVIEAARTKPFGFQAFYPGPGLGGHCIPIDPFYLTWIARQHGLATRFIELAGEVNTSMPAYVVSRVADALNQRGKPIKGSRVAILGMAYKRDVDDPRESPGFELMDLLLEKGAVVTYNDPHIPRLPAMRRYPHLKMDSQPVTDEYLSAQDCVLIATDHSAYDYERIVDHAQLVVDTRNATRTITTGREKIVKA
jgi:UDP-N-acetyl-D-glucosamine dehydrogenase